MPLLSPTIQRLQQALQANEPDALPAFWQEVAQRDIPLIEAASDGDSLVTFVWRHDGAARNVAVIQDFGTDGIREHHMTRLPNSDLWILTRRLHADTRTTYQISPSTDDDRSVAGPYQLDPLNPKTYPGFLFEDGGTILFSLLELPDAPPLPWRAYQTLHAGSVALHRPFADQRRLWLYTPAVTPPTSLPALLVFDGRIYKDLLCLPQILDYLIETGAIPPIVALMVDNVDRSELHCQPAYAAFIAEQVIPWLCANAPVTSDPAQTVVLGSSSGGLGALYLASQYGHIVGTVCAQSGWFRWMPEGDPAHHWLARQLASVPTLPLRVLLQVGNLETAQMADGGPSQLTANRHMRDTLAGRVAALAYQEYSGGHDTSSLEAPLAQGLVALFGGQ